MTGHKIGVYYAWSRPGEIGAPLSIIENRFPTVFELRRMLYPRYEELSDPRLDQGVGGFLDHIMKQNFAAFVAQASSESGHPVIELERVHDAGGQSPIDAVWLESLDTLIVISFDSMRTNQTASDLELDAIRSFLAAPENLLVVCLHHNIGDTDASADAERRQCQEVEFHHHGDKTIPPQQRFGSFGRSLLEGIGLPVENQYGLRPATEPDGSPSPIEMQIDLDRSGFLKGVTNFNHHPHLPHLERLGEAVSQLEVLARQRIDLTAPPHPFTHGGRSTFDALLQSRPGAFKADLLVCDATLWSSTAGGIESLRCFWSNVIQRNFPQ